MKDFLKIVNSKQYLELVNLVTKVAVSNYNDGKHRCVEADCPGNERKFKIYSSAMPRCTTVTMEQRGKTYEKWLEFEHEAGVIEELKILINLVGLSKNLKCCSFRIVEE